MTRESQSSHNHEITAMQTDKRHGVRSKSQKKGFIEQTDSIRNGSSTYSPGGQYIEYTGNTIKNNKSVLAGIPVADDIFPGTIKAAVYNLAISEWEVQEVVDLSSFNENDYTTIVNSGAL